MQQAGAVKRQQRRGSCVDRHALPPTVVGRSPRIFTTLQYCHLETQTSATIPSAAHKVEVVGGMQRLGHGPRHLIVRRTHRLHNRLGLAALASSLARRLAHKAIGVAQQLWDVLGVLQHGHLVLGLQKTWAPSLCNLWGQCGGRCAVMPRKETGAVSLRQHGSAQLAADPSWSSLRRSQRAHAAHAPLVMKRPAGASSLRTVAK